MRQASNNGANMTRNLKDVLDAYIECAIFADTPDGEDCSGPSPEFEKKAREDVEDFLSLVTERRIDSPEWTDEQFGHDFWLTRQHHGAGFWDRGHGAVGDTLTNWAQTYSTKYAYVGDDGLFYAD